MNEDREALEGLMRGKLEPLRQYLLSGAPLTEALRCELVCLLREPGDYEDGAPDTRDYLLKLSKRLPGRGTLLTDFKDLSCNREREIAAFVEQELPKQGGKKYLAIEEAMKRFAAGKTTVKNALRVAEKVKE